MEDLIREYCNESNRGRLVKQGDEGKLAAGPHSSEHRLARLLRHFAKAATSRRTPRGLLP